MRVAVIGGGWAGLAAAVVLTAGGHAVTLFEAGRVLEGKVVSIKEFGAFVEFAPGKEGMVHISKIAKQRTDHVEDVLSIGDHVKVVCLGKDKMGRLSFSIKDVAE